MKKIFLAMLLLLALTSETYGAASEDTSVYVRQDVFDAKMDSFMNEIRGEFRVINAKLEALDKRIDDLQTSTNERFSALQASTNERFSDLQTSTGNRFNDLQATTADRIDDLKTIIYWGLSILGLLIAFAIFGPSFGEFLRNLRQPSITLEDVKRLIAEAKLNEMPHA